MYDYGDYVNEVVGDSIVAGIIPILLVAIVILVIYIPVIINNIRLWSENNRANTEDRDRNDETHQR